MDLGGFIRRESVVPGKLQSQRNDLKTSNNISELNHLETTIIEKNSGNSKILDWDDSSDSFREEHDVHS